MNIKCTCMQLQQHDAGNCKRSTISLLQNATNTNRIEAASAAHHSFLSIQKFFRWPCSHCRRIVSVDRCRYVLLFYVIPSLPLFLCFFPSLSLCVRLPCSLALLDRYAACVCVCDVWVFFYSILDLQFIFGIERHISKIMLSHKNWLKKNSHGDAQ